jgi:hypothetical protein
MDTARERARRRIVAFFQREGAPTQEAFAETVGYGQSWVSKILTRGPKLEDLDAIARAMHITVEQLVGERDLVRHTPPVQPSSAVEDVADAADHPGVLQTTLPHHAALAAEVHRTIAALAQFAAVLDREAAAVGQSSAGPDRRHRQVG